MTPTPQNYSIYSSSPSELKDDDVVITGMSGLFPDSHSVKEFGDNLYNKVNMVRAQTRWNYKHPEVSEYSGSVPDLHKFDAQFFMVHYRLAETMDTTSKKIMENSYQAIYDAGINPNELSGSKIGSFVGTGLSESEKFCFYATVGFGILGCSRAMFSNRISYFLNGHGPSMTVDGACSGSMVALEKAYEAISSGECNAAIVGGCSIHLHPQTYIHYGRLMEINPDGKTKCFDQNADGLSQSEAISVLFLQKYKNAKRVYAKLCFAKTEFSAFNDGTTGMPFGPYRPLEVSTKFLRKCYEEAGIPPSQVEFVEAFGTAIAESEKSELETIEKIFCDEQRQKHLVVGSVTSNMGFSDASSGLAAITKVCIGYQSGIMPGNLHCDNPRNDIAALRDGRIKIASDHTPFDRSYVAVNNISLTGINAHALLSGVYRPKDPKRYLSPIPHLVTVSGRTEAAVKRILDDLKTRPVDPEEIALFHNIHRLRISKHMGRGFSILATNENEGTVSLCEKVDYYDEAKRPLWFVYSGMGSQWTGMGTHLLRIPVFATAIQRCHEVLKPKGINLIHILTTDDNTIYDNILHSFVGIAAIQIGLTDVLKSIGIVPNKIIGHSVGELGCAYADGCFTAEEMILSAYSRGLVSVQTPFIKGSMAAIGLGFNQIKLLCPPEIEIASHNSSESCTISGPTDIMKIFVDQLTAKGIFAKEVPCSNIAFHSRYIKNAGPGLLKYLSEVIKTPKPRSEKWLSTSVPQDKWEEPLAKYSSAEYHTNNLLSPVLFEETTRLIPPNAVLVEIAPHGLLQAILKRSLPNCAHVPLTRRGHKENAVYLLEALGSLFMHGYDPDLKYLYPKIDFPVSSETRSLSHLVEWMHTENWGLPLYFEADRRIAASANFFISIYDTEYDSLRGHVLHGVVTYPAAGILSCVWDTLLMSLDVKKQELSVQFREVYLFSVPALNDKTALKLSVEIHKGSGKFEVTNDKVLIATGVILAMTPETQVTENTNDDEAIIAADDVYRMLYEKGHDYGGEFRSIHSINSSLTRSQIYWTGNWITFLDGIIQTYALRLESNATAQPSYIHEITIDLKRHFNEINAARAQGFIEANYYKAGDICACGGVIVKNMRFIQKSAPKRQEVMLKTLKYVPYFSKDTMEISTALYLFLQIISENIINDGITSLEVCDSKKDSLSSYMSRMTGSLKHLNCNFNSVNKAEFVNTLQSTEMPHVIMLNNFALDRKLNEELHQALPQDSFLIILEESSRTNNFYRILASTMTPRGRMVLAKWRPSPLSQQPATVVTVTSTKDILLLHAMRQKMQNQKKLVVLTLYPSFHGLKDLIQKYRKESQCNKVYLAMVDENNLQSIQGQQLPDFDFAFNVLSKGTWGTEVYMPYEDYLTNSSDVILRSPKDGNIDSLQWAEAPAGQYKDKIGVTVHYAGLSYMDAKKATGEALNHLDNLTNYTYGMDFSGMTKHGERVMGLIQSGSAASQIQAEPLMLWPVPVHWSLEDAATVPLAYAHAFYCLAIKAQLKRGMRILVHGAAGGLGQAVISIGIAHGCKIFATVSDAKKKRFIKRLFPEIPEEHIGNSRDLTFEDMVLNMTHGKGCDLIISCLKGKLANALPLGDYGLVLDTHNLHANENFQIGMYSLTRARSYKAIDFSSLFTYDNKKEMEILQVLISDGIAKGFVRPLTRVSYGWNEAQRAVRLLASSKHRGRVLLHLRGSSPLAQPALKLSDSGSYFVISDEKDSMLAINLINLLVVSGARNIVMHFNQTKVQGEGHLKMKIRSWQKSGVTTKVSKEKITKSEQVDTYIASCKKLGNLDGIFLVASSPDSNSETELVSLIECLDKKSKKLCPSLRHFTIITETSNFAQHICLKRSKDGFPAMLLQLNKTEKYNEFGVTITSPDESTLVWPNVIEAIEKGIYASQTVTLAEPRKILQTTILEEISKLPGVNLKAGMPDDTALETLGLDEVCISKIIEILYNKFNITNVSRSMVTQLTIAQIKQMQEDVNPSTYKIEAGLSTFISEVDTDELLMNTTHVMLPTLVQNSLMREDEFDNTQTFLVIIPGLDGLYSRFLTLAERLKIPALTIQPGSDHLNESIQDTAQRFTKFLNKVLKPKDKFYLLGYSSGTMIALEMAAILEEQGLKGVVYCVDADPETFPDRLTSWLNISQGEDQFHNSLMMHMYTIMCRKDQDRSGLEDRLGKLNTWDDKLKLVLTEILEKITLSKQYAQNTIEAVHARINQVLNYDGRDKLKQKLLKSQIVLLKTHCGFASESVMERYTTSTLHVYNIKSDHARVLDDHSCTSIINMHLDKDILDAFEKRNLCNTYLLNAENYAKQTN